MSLKVYFGEETYLLHQEISRLKDDFIQQTSSLGIQELDLSISTDNFIEICFSSDMFSPNKMIIYWGLPTVDSARENWFMNSLKKIPDEHTVIIAIDGRPDKRRKLVKHLLEIYEHKEFQSYSPSTHDTLVNFIVTDEQKRGFSITAGTTNELIIKTGYDLWNIESELRKIESYCGDNNSIKSEYIQTLVSSVEGPIFEFLDIYRKRNKIAVMKWLQEISKPDDCFGLLSMLMNHIRLLLLLVDNPKLSDADLGKKISKNPWYLGKLRNDLRIWSFSELFSMLQQANDIDFESKSGKISPKIGLELLCSQL